MANPCTGRSMYSVKLVVAAAMTCVTTAACAQSERADLRTTLETEVRTNAASVLDRVMREIELRAGAVDEALRPVSLLSATEEASLRRSSNEQHLARARSLGVSPVSDFEAVEAYERSGRLVVLEDSTEYWVIRELEHSVPAVTPGTKAFLVELGERFQERLGSMGIPPLRLEVTSVLRTAESQSDLRRTNGNAARGTSAHEYGTTVDIAYSSFPAPFEQVNAVWEAEASWLVSYLRKYEAAAVERVAARRSHELKAILGRVLRELQSEGKVLVMLEERQPVYHLTIAK